MAWSIQSWETIAFIAAAMASNRQVARKLLPLLGGP
jgi:hypothetical protein